ncbi:MAG: glycine cleavage system aminomethyltransferase GcvT [Deltaproteobacteria bacterium]|jgi:aminomethyltransferase|nr:glycine cleavage system aminomethyltransferase GcvT [Deltaproteobacteria bacterium]
MSKIKKTPYFNKHKEAGAQIVDFAGFEMPMKYSGIKKEHLAVRKNVGLFDVSHMGIVQFKGKDAIKSVNYMITNDLERLENGHALYTPICNESGTIVDDCIVYRRGQEDIMIVINASNRQKDFEWFENHTPATRPENVSDKFALLALQGPSAEALLQSLVKEDLGKVEGFGLGYIDLFGDKTMIARTGYTGEDGFEIFVPLKNAEEVWDLLLEKGKKYKISPAGLGARDTLRLEAKLWLYGNDISEKTTPLEAGMSFAVKLDKDDFIGKDVLVKQKKSKPDKRLIGFKIKSKGIARPGHKVHYVNKEGEVGKEIGEVTSGTKVPYLNEAVGMAYVPRKYSRSGRELAIKKGKKHLRCLIHKGPFYKR